MNETEFHRNLSGAEILIRLSEDPSFFEGYRRGLRRYYHGDSFVSREEHESLMALADNAGDEQGRAKGEGYRLGLSGTAITDIIERMTA
ncbi:MAG: hypothetical protein M0R18_01660 [Deltaproteobacteria bacterium]|jgi:hypothetical protein|nr:hypothetical protein [Deltaproteobacteria bacterium]MDD3619052.1 hypothetical protein [Desulfobulbaceae bacterium]